SEGVAPAEKTEVFLGRSIILFVVVLESEPLENFGRDSSVWIAGEEAVHFLCQGRAIFQIEKGRDDSKRSQVVILLLVQLPGGIERRQRPFVVLRFKGRLPDVIIGLGRDRAFWKFFQQL